MLAFAALSLAGLNSCTRDGDVNFYGPYLTPAERALNQKAEDLQKFLVGRHFIPVDFYADHPIDYIEENTTVLSETDLKKYILPHLADDIIPFNADKSLPVNQEALKMPGNDSTVLNRTWNVSTSKEKNEVYMDYLDYFYRPLRYTIVEFKGDRMLAFVNWRSKANPTKTARLYTWFQAN